MLYSSATHFLLQIFAEESNAHWHGMDVESLHRLAALARSCLGLAEAELERARTDGLRTRVVRLRLLQLKRAAELLEQLARAGEGDEGDG